MRVRSVGLPGCVFLMGACGEPVKGPPPSNQAGTESDTAMGNRSMDTGSLSTFEPTSTSPQRGVYADVILDAPGAIDGPFGDPEFAVNGVRGGGKNKKG